MSTQDILNNLNDNFSLSVPDPIGGTLLSLTNKINALTNTIDQKIDKLVDDAVKSVDNKGTVEYSDNTLVITVTSQDKQRAQTISNNIQQNISSINNSLTILNNSIKALNVLSQSTRVLSTAMDIQDLLLSSNPLTGSTYGIIKKALKIINLKDVIKEYNKMMAQQVSTSNNMLQQLLNKFTDINVQIKISDEKQKGTNIDANEAQKIIAQQLLNGSSDIDIDYSTENYINVKNKQYILIIKKYGEKELQGQAKDKFSGLLVAQTAPSLTSTPEDLFNELKIILDAEGEIQ